MWYGYNRPPLLFRCLDRWRCRRSPLLLECGAYYFRRQHHLLQELTQRSAQRNLKCLQEVARPLRCPSPWPPPCHLP